VEIKKPPRPESAGTLSGTRKVYKAPTRNSKLSTATDQLYNALRLSTSEGRIIELPVRRVLGCVRLDGAED